MQVVLFVFGFVLGTLSYLSQRCEAPCGALTANIFPLICLGGWVEEKNFLSRVTARLLVSALARFHDLRNPQAIPPPAASLRAHDLRHSTMSLTITPRACEHRLSSLAVTPPFCRLVGVGLRAFDSFSGCSLRGPGVSLAAALSISLWVWCLPASLGL